MPAQRFWWILTRNESHRYCNIWNR